MKKKNFIVLLTAISMAFGLMACGDNADIEVDDSQKTVEEEDGSDTADVKTNLEDYDEITEEVVRNHIVTEASDFQYTPMGDGIGISGYTGTDTIVVIPEEIDGQPVTMLGSIFWNDSTVQGVLIPNGVKELGSTFANNQCIEVVIAEGVEVLGDVTFGNCPKLHTVVLSDSLTTITSTSFAALPALKELYIPDTVIDLPDYISWSEDFVIKGKSGSYIETYCSEYGIKFEAVD